MCSCELNSHVVFVEIGLGAILCLEMCVPLPVTILTLVMPSSPQHFPFVVCSAACSAIWIYHWILTICLPTGPDINCYLYLLAASSFYNHPLLAHHPHSARPLINQAVFKLSIHVFLWFMVHLVSFHHHPSLSFDILHLLSPSLHHYGQSQVLSCFGYCLFIGDTSKDSAGHLWLSSVLANT